MPTRSELRFAMEGVACRWQARRVDSWHRACTVRSVVGASFAPKAIEGLPTPAQTRTRRLLDSTCASGSKVISSGY
jgi:hypothetical protein